MVIIILNCSVAEIYSDNDAIMTIITIMTRRCGNKTLMRVVAETSNQQIVD